ncbi:NAD(P)/FAD-dependent oxidoreductase [Aureimonas altamirensis]|uniref:NAD(P)/FAD-dependent oxidoreductase n=1 Tax=Aureimonas altamirensis TaxID=370622 RepID=UPI00068EC326|nr:FAD-dependent oxidoreductase [Aureimonas altamirensis]
MARQTRILILGGGAGGLELAVQLAGTRGIDVTLIDRVTSHLWKPRLHEFAAGTVSSSLAEISFYVLGQLRGFHFEQGSVIGIEHAMKAVRLAAILDDAGEIVVPERLLTYDLCVVALGGVTPDFNTTGVAENAIRLDAANDADAFRQRFINEMIRARATGVPADVVIVGSGATGTELAAHLRASERAFFDWSSKGPVPRGRKLLDITVLEAAPELMPGAEPALREKLVERLRGLDIKTVTDARISVVDKDEIRTAKGEAWPVDISVWAAGLVGNPVLRSLGRFVYDDRGRIEVDNHLRSTVDDCIYVLGDAAACIPAGAERPLPPTAQAASQQAAYLAAALPRVLRNEPVKPFRFHNKGRLVSLAGAGAIGMIGRRKQDILIHGQFAIAAYDALQRQHQWRVLGPVRGSVAIIADLLSPTRGPPLKLHAG